jgi:hypothetical protein
MTKNANPQLSVGENFTGTNGPGFLEITPRVSTFRAREEELTAAGAD